MKYTPQIIELADGTKCVALEDFRRECDEAREAIRALAEHGESEIQRITKERDEAHSILEQVTDRLEQATIELIKLQSQRDEAWDNLKITQQEWARARRERAEALRKRDDAQEESLEQARLLGISGERECRLIAERDEAKKKYDIEATEHMLNINKCCNQRDAAMDVLEEISLYLSSGIGDENTTAQQYKDRIIDGIKHLAGHAWEERCKYEKLWKEAEAEKTNLIKELKEAWLAMDEIEGTDRINKWQNKNAHVLGKA
jgi:hypothetical protein